MKKLGFLNTLLKYNLFIYWGLTVLLRPVDTKVNTSLQVQGTHILVWDLGGNLKSP